PRKVESRKCGRYEPRAEKGEFRVIVHRCEATSVAGAPCFAERHGFGPWTREVDVPVTNGLSLGPFTTEGFIAAKDVARGVAFVTVHEVAVVAFLTGIDLRVTAVVRSS